MTSADPTGLHDWHSEAYVHEWIDAQVDSERRVLLQNLVDLIPFDPDEELRVLDVGGGYGALTRVVLETFPRARVVLHDYSAPMLVEARSRLANYSDSLSYVQTDLMTSAWTRALEGQFQAVVSSIAIHNVRYPDRIRSIYHEIFPFVAPGGCFLNFDQFSSSGGLVAGAERHAQLMGRRRRLYEQTGEWRSLANLEAEVAARRRSRPQSAEGSDVSDRMSSHDPATVTNQLRWLLEAGFSQAECFWRDSRRAIIGGYAAPS